MKLITVVFDGDGVVMISPIIVCGMPRSGTSMARDLLKSMPDVYVINGEPSIKLLRCYYDFIYNVENVIDQRGGKPSQSVFAKNKDLLSLIALASIDKYAKNVPKALFSYGYFVAKSPAFEFHIDELKGIFTSSVRPRFIYCTRSPDRVWKSLSSMPWNNRSVSSFRSRCIKSHKVFHKYLKTSEACGAVFDLDAYVASNDKFGFLRP